MKDKEINHINISKEDTITYNSFLDEVMRICSKEQEVTEKRLQKFADVVCLFIDNSPGVVCVDNANFLIKGFIQISDDCSFIYTGLKIKDIQKLKDINHPRQEEIMNAMSKGISREDIIFDPNHID